MEKTYGYIPVLSIAGSDCSGGAGIQADIKTISALGCYGMTAITAITAQNTTGVASVEGVSPQMVSEQIDAVFTDIRPRAVKIGMLFNAAIVETVADALQRHDACNVILDPVMVSTSGHRLIADDAIQAIVDRLFPISELITPNFHEACLLTGSSSSSTQADILRRLGARNILLKGGDTPGNLKVKTDLFYAVGTDRPTTFESKAIATRNTHGTGCTLSSAIAAFLARGNTLTDAIAAAKQYISHAIETGADINIGHGHGPLNHLFNPQSLIITESYENTH